MIRSDHAAFQQRPKTLNALCVNVAAHVFARAMADKLMSAVIDSDRVISAKLIGDHERRMSLGNFPNESGQRISVGALHQLANDVALAGDCANDCHLARRNATSAFVFLAVFPMAIDVLSADERFVYFDNAHEFAELRVFHSGAQTHAHIPRRLIRAGSEHPMDLQRADSLLARDHQVQNLEPYDQRLLRFLEDRSGSKRKPIRRAWFRAALHTLPVPRSRRAFVHMIVVATWAVRASGPTAHQQIRAACFLIREQRIEVAERHLSDESRLVFVLYLRHDSDISANARVSQEPDNPPKRRFT